MTSARTEALWITGAGLVTAVGASRDATFRALVRGDRGIRQVSLFDTAGQRSTLAAEVRDSCGGSSRLQSGRMCGLSGLRGSGSGW